LARDLDDASAFVDEQRDERVAQVVWARFVTPQASAAFA
jgi:hypothetical protein